jgi:hypothetical protein
MKKTFLIAGLFALAACDEAKNSEAGQAEVAAVDEVDPATEAGFEAVAPGKYEIVHADGSVDELTILPGMTWAMVSAQGEPSGGTLFEQAGKKCFVTEGVPGQRCFSGTEPASDGSIEVTGDDGEKATVRPAKPADSPA